MAGEKSADVLENIDLVFEDKSVAAEADKDTNELCDEFCPDRDYDHEDLSDKNAAMFRFINNDSILSESLLSFKIPVKRTFQEMKVEKQNQIFDISGYEQLKGQSQLFIKVKDNPDVIAAVRSMKSDNTFLRKMPARKTKL